MYDFARHMKDEPHSYYPHQMLKDEARELFKFVREQNPVLFDMFYRLSKSKLGGKL